MPARKVRRAVGWFLILLAAIAGLWCLYVLLPQDQTIRLPDGSVLTLRGWSYGKNHVLMGRSGAWWQLYLPLKQIENYGTEKECLVVWLIGSATHPIPVNGNQTPEHWWDWVEVADEQGHHVVSTNPNQKTPDLILSNGNVQEDLSQSDTHRRTLTIHSFPRRGKKVILRFYAANRPQPVAVFTLPNPTPGPFPSPPPASLPCVSKDGDLKCTLTAITPPLQYFQIAPGGGWTGVSVPKEGAPLQPGEALEDQAVFRVEASGKETRDWIPSRVSLSDSTGNSYDVRTWGQGPGISLHYLAPFCTGEPIQMKVHFVRSLNANVPAAQQWRLPMLPLPTIRRSNTSTLTLVPGQIAPSGGELHASGMAFRLMGIAGPGVVKWETTDRDTLLSNLYSVRVKIIPPDRGYSLFVKGTDDQGHAIVWSTPSSYTLAPGWQECAETGLGPPGKVITFFNLTGNSRSYSHSETPGVCEETFFFRPHSGAKSVRLTFAINRSYDFTFRVPPRL